MDSSAMSLKSTEDIPLADDDLEVIINDDESSKYMQNGRSLDSIASSYTNGNSSPRHFLENECPDADEQEERARLITQVLELQNTLDDLSQRVDSVKEENMKLRSENQVLGQYIENLMSASSVFQSTNQAQGAGSSSSKKK
ncbi:short coiled-coil protein B [Uranotaenia lowii]|uniref:short coiled-coil protein B n=1 Tax=Uranotaenia lowii TaxID=190385 RepID=UPI00247A0AA4|nr:short coiled-coil protein B [Uranotaenia lowii]XP_055613720.1 short coiled-coil protein B [Uranotaenia lowii]